MKLILIGCLLVASPSLAVNRSKALAKGTISTEGGGKCSFTQQVVEEYEGLFKLTTTAGIMKLKPKCLKETDLNKMMSLNVLSRWHSLPDAKFKTKTGQWMKTSSMQKRGICIQSATYAMKGIAVDFKVSGGFITEIVHASTVGACK